MLHVAKLSNNLLSNHKITQDLNCVVIFFLVPIVFLGSCHREDDWNCQGAGQVILLIA